VGATANRCAIAGPLRCKRPGARPCQARVASSLLISACPRPAAARWLVSGMGALARSRLRRFRHGDPLGKGRRLSRRHLQAHQAGAGGSPDGAVATRPGGTPGWARPGPPRQLKIALHRLVRQRPLDWGIDASIGIVGDLDHPVVVPLDGIGLLTGVRSSLPRWRDRPLTCQEEGCTKRR